jgi:hypothetical protein
LNSLLFSFAFNTDGQVYQIIPLGVHRILFPPAGGL